MLDMVADQFIAARVSRETKARLKATAERRGMVASVPTAHAAEPLSAHIASSADPLLCGRPSPERFVALR
jgi:hypothetical protein